MRKKLKGISKGGTGAFTVGQPQINRRGKKMIYNYYKQFPDVHPNIVLKCDLNRQGQRFSKEARAAFQQRDEILWKGYSIFSYDVQRTVYYADKIPKTFHFNDGFSVMQRMNENSPYVIDYRDGKFVITEQGEIICDRVFFDSKPKYYDMTLEDGTPMQAVVNATNDYLFIALNKYCELWKGNNQCRFCNLVAHSKQQRESGVEEVVTAKQPSQLVEALRTIRWLEPRFWVVVITGGTITSKYRGETELEFYINRLNAIREGLRGIWIPACLQIGVQDDEGWKRLHETGVPSIQSNIEVWGKEMFEWMCPGKAKYAGGFDEWVRRVIRSVDFWGVGKVSPNFVVGVEMAKPYGFKDVKSGVDNLRRGWDFLMRNGVVPRYAYWTLEAESELTKVPGQQYAPLEYYIEVEKAYAETRWKYNLELPYPAVYNLYDYALASMNEFEYYHGTGIMSKKWLEAKGGMPEILRPRDSGYVA